MNWPGAVLLPGAPPGCCSIHLPPTAPAVTRSAPRRIAMQVQRPQPSPPPSHTAQFHSSWLSGQICQGWEAQDEDCTAPTPQSAREGFKSCKQLRLIAWHQDALEARSHTNAGFLQIYATWHATGCETMRLHKILKTQQVPRATALKAALAHCKAHTHKPERTHAMHAGISSVCISKMHWNAFFFLNTEFKQIR